MMSKDEQRFWPLDDFDDMELVIEAIGYAPTAIVDEIAGGIIAYVSPESAALILDALNGSVSDDESV